VFDDAVAIKRGVMGKVCLVYAGGRRENILGGRDEDGGHVGMGYNLHLSVGEREITIAEAHISVQGVSPAKVCLTVTPQ